MDNLFQKYYQKIDRTPVGFSRYLLDQIDWNDRLIGIKGARGAGKTTMLFQSIKIRKLPQENKTLYVSLDDLYFSDNTLYDLADRFVKAGGDFLFLDEVHRYKNWSSEMKNIYDDFPDLKILFTGSSLLHLDKARGDLSRRAVMYELHGLSFREYLNFSTGKNFTSFSLAQILKNHVSLSRAICREIRPLAYFKDYLHYGYYPYFIENKASYLQKLEETILLAFNTDLPASYDISYGNIEKMKQLLQILAESVPFKPNVSKLSNRIGVSRKTMIDFFKYLEDLRIIKRLFASTKGIGLLQKPEKIFLHHPNLHYALSPRNSNTGNIRESFFQNQTCTQQPVVYTSTGDFKIEESIFEVGGKNKTGHQIKDLENGFLALDDIEIGFGNQIPLWLFGFLY